MGNTPERSEWQKAIEDLGPELRRTRILLRWWWRKPAVRLVTLEIAAILTGIFLKEGAFARYGSWEYGLGKADFSDYATAIWFVLLVVPLCWVWRKPIVRWINRITR